MAVKKKQDTPAAGGDQEAKIAGLEEKIGSLSAQLEEALKKQKVDPDLVESLTNRIASLEEKLEEAEKISKIELPKDPPDEDPEKKGKKPAAKKPESGEGVGMF